MEYSRNTEQSATTRPVVTYEGEVFSSATYRENDTLRLSPDMSYVIGFDAIDKHVESLLEQWETDDNIAAGIDAYTIFESFPDHYQPPTTALQETLIADVNRAIESGGDRPTALIIHAMQVPALYDALTRDVLAQITTSNTPLDQLLGTPLIDGYLNSYAQMNLTQGGKMEALRHILLACKSDDSAL